MKIDKLNIIAIYPLDTLEKINYINIKEPSNIKYLEVGADDFTSYLNNPSYDFLNYNKNTLYIIKEGNYIDIKNILIYIAISSISYIFGMEIFAAGISILFYFKLFYI